MSIEFLQSKKANHELKIIELDLLEVLPELKFRLEVPDAATKIDYSRKTLEEGQIILPVLDINTLLPLQFKHVKNGKTVGKYPSFSNYIGYEIDYQRGDIMKIIIIEGVKVLKKSDEQFDDIIRLIETELHFEYHFGQERWKKLDDVEIFNKKQKEIEEAMRSNEVMDYIVRYFNARETLMDELAKMRAINPLEAPKFVLEQLQVVKDYHWLQNAIGEIPDRNYELIMEQIQAVEDFTQKLQTHIDNNSLSEYKIKDALSDLRTEHIHKLFNVEGYWVDEEEVYFNAARFHALKQKAEASRTPAKQRLLKRALFAHRQLMIDKTKKQKLHEVKDINNPTFTKFMKELE